MSDQVKLTAFATAECEARTIGDLRALLRWCDKYGVSDGAGIDWGRGSVYVEITGDCAVPAEWIVCGAHRAGDQRWSVLIETHTHKGPETYEEAREEALEREPAPFDWPTRDRLNRYGDDARPE